MLAKTSQKTAKKPNTGQSLTARGSFQPVRCHGCHLTLCVRDTHDSSYERASSIAAAAASRMFGSTWE
jgi:hypothetical protein